VRALTTLFGRDAVRRIVGQARRYPGEYQIALFDSNVVQACLDGLGPEETS